MTFSLTARLYSKMTGDEFSSMPSESIRPPCLTPVEYSDARKRTPNRVSILRSTTVCSDFSSATDELVSSVAAPLVRRNSFRSDMLQFLLDRRSALGCESAGDRCAQERAT